MLHVLNMLLLYRTSDSPFFLPPLISILIPHLIPFSERETDNETERVVGKNEIRTEAEGN